MVKESQSWQQFRTVLIRELFISTMIHAHQFSREGGHSVFFHWEEGDKGQTGKADSQDLAPHSRGMDVNFLIFPSILSQLLDVWEEKEVIQNQL